MTLRPLILMSLLSLTATAALAGAGVPVDVYKSPYCGCCTKWVEHLRREGFEVKTHDVEDVPAQRARLGMPETYGSCHTARIGNYLVEGHVPAADVRRLLKDKPKAIGLAVPSMPPGSPGMESAKPMPYETLLIGANGSSSVFARH